MVSALMFAFTDKDEGEYGIIDNVYIIGIDAFADDGFPIVLQDLADAHELGENEIGEAFLAECAPCFAVIVVLGKHHFSGECSFGIIALFHFSKGEIFYHSLFEIELNEADDAVIDHGFEFAGDILSYFLGLFFLYGADALRLDKDLVHDTDGAQYPPAGAVIACLLQKNVPAGVNYFVVLLIGHSKNDGTFGAKNNEHTQMFTLNCSGRMLVVDKPVVMGIINVTPDSFYSDSRITGDAVVKQAERMLQQGAAILDIGGQSTRPGSERVSVAEETDRVVPAIENILRAFPGTVISIDTYQSAVAAAAVRAGAGIVNDISSGEMDENMLPVVATLKVPYICMHMQGTPDTMQQQPVYEDVTREVLDYFIKKMEDCRKAGIHDIILDPGIGFGKTTTHNFELIRNLDVFNKLGKPVLLGVSRKSVIWRSLEITPEEALNGTTVLNTMGLMNGAAILRVHDVKEAVEAVKLFELYQG